MSAVSTGIPPQIEQQLLVLDKQIRDATFIRGTGRLVLGSSLFLGCGLLLDACLGLNGTIRGMLLAGWILLGLGLLWRCIIRPMFTPVSFASLAALVEQQFPELRERLTSLVELRGSEGTELAPGASKLMQDLLARQTVKAFNQLSIDQISFHHGPLRVVLIAAVAVVMLFAPFAWNSSAYGLLLGRFFVPWGNFSWGSRLVLTVVEGDQVVARGSDVPIHVTVTSRAGGQPVDPEKISPLQLNWRDVSNASDQRRFVWDAQTSTFVTTVPHVPQSLTFDVATEGARTRIYRIDVADPPVMTRFQMEIEPAAYTGLPARSLTSVPAEVRMPESTRVLITVEFNEPVVEARLLWPVPSQEQMQPLSPPSQKTAVEESIPIKLSADRTSGTVEVLATVTGPITIRAKNLPGLQNTDPSRTLFVTPDEPPEITLSGVDKPVFVRPDDRFEQSIEVDDDFGLSAVEMHVEASTGVEKRETLPADQLHDLPLNHTFVIDLSQLKLSGGQIVTYRMRAVDNRPDPAPQETWTTPRTLMVNTSLQQLPDQELAAEKQQLEDELIQLRAELNDSKEAMTQLHQQTEKEALGREPQSEKNEQLDALQNEQDLLLEKLQKLSDLLAQRQMTQELTAQTDQIADEDLKVAQERLEQARNKSSRDQLEPIAQAIDRTGAADKKLQMLERQLNELNKLEQDLAELSRLAQRAERLAEELDKLDQLRESNSPSPESQVGMEKELENHETRVNQADSGSLQKLKDEGGKLSKQMDELLRKHPELLDAARRDKQEQLDQLAEQARQLAEAQNRLSETLKREAENAPAVASRPENSQPQNSRSEDLQSEIHSTENSSTENGEMSQGAEQAKAETKTASEHETGDKDALDGKENKSNPGDGSEVASSGENSQQPDSTKSPTNNSDNAQSPKTKASQAEMSENAHANRQEVAQAPAQMNSGSTAKPDSPSGERDSQEARSPTDSDQGASAEKASRERGADALNRQEQITREATQQALDLARETGADAPATKSAAEFARKAELARQQLQAGEIAEAAKSARQAERASEETRQQLNPDGQSKTPQSNQAEQLAQQQREAAGELEKLAQSPEAVRGAQMQGQRQIASATSKLAEKLNDAAEALKSTPLNASQDASNAAEAGDKARQATQQAEQAMRQSERANSQQDPQQTASAAADAAEKLQKAAGEVKPTPPRPLGTTPVPKQLGTKVADATRQIKSAQQKLEQADRLNRQSENGSKSETNSGSPPSPTKSPAQTGSPSKEGKPGERTSSQKPNAKGEESGQGKSDSQPQGSQSKGSSGQSPTGGQSGQGQSGQGQSGQGQSGQGQSGQGQSGQGQSGQGQSGEGQPGEQPGEGSTSASPSGSGTAQSSANGSSPGESGSPSKDSPSTNGSGKGPAGGKSEQGQADRPPASGEQSAAASVGETAPSESNSSGEGKTGAKPKGSPSANSTGKGSVGGKSEQGQADGPPASGENSAAASGRETAESGAETPKGENSSQSPQMSSGQPQGSRAASESKGSGKSGQQTNSNNVPESKNMPEAAHASDSKEESALAAAAEQFRQFAKLLKAAREAPKDSRPNGRSKKGTSIAKSLRGESSSNPDSGDVDESERGTTTTADLSHLEIELQQQARQNWGRLPGQLRTEILQGAGKKSHPEYTERIKTYFDEITKPAK